MSDFTFEKESHIYKLNGIVLPSITQILQAEGFTDLSKIPPRVLEASRLFGSASHRACELLDKGSLDFSTLSEHLLPIIVGWKAFKLDNKIFKFLAIEQPMYSKVWKFAGTPDRVYQVNKTQSDIYEIKTTSGLYPSNGLQLAGQEILVEENYKLKVRNRWVVQLDDTGIPKVTPYKDKSDRTVFLSSINIFKWKERYSR